MKSKNKTFMYLCLLVALFNIQPSFAKENSESTTTSEQTDIKSGDEIIITEIEPSENTQTTTVTVEEKKPQKPASKKPDESQSDKAENKQRPSPTIDPRAAEVNERVNQKYIVCASNEKINWLKVEILHEYISDFMDNISSIGMTVDEAIEILQQRNQANG